MRTPNFDEYKAVMPYPQLEQLILTARELEPVDVRYILSYICKAYTHDPQSFDLLKLSSKIMNAIQDEDIPSKIKKEHLADINVHNAKTLEKRHNIPKNVRESIVLEACSDFKSTKEIVNSFLEKVVHEDGDRTTEIISNYVRSILTVAGFKNEPRYRKEQRDRVRVWIHKNKNARFHEIVREVEHIMDREINIWE